MNAEPNFKPAKVKPDPAYLDKVRALPCVCCGAMLGNDAHHCQDKPPFTDHGLYQRLPSAARRSGDHDAIPLCPNHHRMFHLRRSEFHAQFGVDYQYIATTRATLSDMEVDF